MTQLQRLKNQMKQFGEDVDLQQAALTPGQTPQKSQGIAADIVEFYDDDEIYETTAAFQEPDQVEHSQAPKIMGNANN